MKKGTHKKFCKRGHELSEDNLLSYELSKGVYSCKECVRLKAEEKSKSKEKKPRSNQNKNKQYCIRGHPLFGDNLKIDKTGRRLCVTCIRNKHRIFNQKPKRKEYVSNWKKDNPNKVSEYNKTFREKNPDYSTKWDNENPDIRREINKRHDQKPKRRIYRLNWKKTKYWSNAEFRKLCLQQNKQWRLENPRSGMSYPEDVSLAMMERRLLDMNKCQWSECGATSRDCSIHVNHILPISKYPEKGSDVNNLICYCEYHHAYWHYIKNDPFWKMICSELGSLVESCPNQTLISLTEPEVDFMSERKHQ